MDYASAVFRDSVRLRVEGSLPAGGGRVHGSDTCCLWEGMAWFFTGRDGGRKERTSTDRSLVEVFSVVGLFGILDRRGEFPFP